MRAYSAHNRLHVNARTQCRFAQSYIIGSARFGKSPLRRTAKILARTDWALRESRQTPLGGQIAMLTGRKLKWDPVKMELFGDAAASKLLSREQRMPWHLA